MTIDWSGFSPRRALAGTIAFGLLAFHPGKRRQTTLLDKPRQSLAAKHGDRRLVVGSALFSIGRRHYRYQAHRRVWHIRKSLFSNFQKGTSCTPFP